MILPHIAYTSMGSPATETHGQLSLTWSAKLTDAQRTCLRAALLATPPKRRRYTRKHVTARALWEQRGARTLAAPDVHERSHALHVVRVYYTSQADELLCFEAVLSSAAAHSLAYAHYRSEIWPLDSTDDHPLQPGARLVVLPSQVDLAFQLDDRCAA